MARAVEVLVAVGDVLAHGAELIPAGPLLEERLLREGTRDIGAAVRRFDSCRQGKTISCDSATRGISRNGVTHRVTADGEEARPKDPPPVLP